MNVQASVQPTNQNVNLYTSYDVLYHISLWHIILLKVIDVGHLQILNLFHGAG